VLSSTVETVQLHRRLQMARQNIQQQEKLDGPVSVWVAHLSWVGLLPLAASFLRYGRFFLWYTSADRAGLAISLVLWRVGIIASKPRRVDLTSHGERVDDPHSASFQIQAMITKFTDQFFATHRGLFREIIYPDARVQHDRITINLRKAAAQVTYDLLVFVELARYWHQVEGIPVSRLVILSPKAVLANTVSPGWAGHDVEFGCLWSQHNSLVLRFGRDVLLTILAAVRPPRPRMQKPAAIAVGASTTGLDRNNYFDDLFWWRDSGIPAERVVLCFDQQGLPARREVVSEAERLGIRCVVLRPQESGDSPHLLWRAAPGPVISMRRLWQKLQVCAWTAFRGSVGRWTANQLLKLLSWAEVFEDFMVEFNVRGVLHTQDTDLDYISVACDAARGARIGFEWSNLHWPVAHRARLHHVYFPWGPHGANVLQAEEACVDHVLMSGCTIAEACPGPIRDGNQYRAPLVARDANRILALFDTSLPCERFYEFFLQRVLKDTRWGLLIKPKHKANLPWVRQRLPELQALYEQALASGRVLMMDWRVSAARAAAAADFSVGVDINSATIIAALAGYRAIHLDYVRLHASDLSPWAHFYKAGPDRLVFEDPEKLWHRLNSYFDDPGCDPTLGVADEHLLRMIDPFRDGQASRRIGEYVRGYLDGLDDGLDRDLALEQATRRYADKWGAEKVVRGLPDGTAPVVPNREPSSPAVVSSSA